MSIAERLLSLPQFATLAVILERAVLFVTSRDDATRLRFELRRLLSDNDLELARRRLEELSMEQNLALLAALARHTPLIGVVGTVIGIQRVIVARMGRANALSHEVMAFLESPAASAAE